MNFQKIALLAVLGLFGLASIAGAVYVVTQRQNVQEKAAEQLLTCQGWSGGSYSDFGKNDQGDNNWFNGLERHENTIKKIHYYGDVSDRIGWAEYKYCDYAEYTAEKGNVDKYYCREGDPGYYNKESNAIHNVSEGNPEYTKDLAEIIDQGHKNGTCQIIQVDVSPCRGGTAYAVHVNPNCPEPDKPNLTCNSLNFDFTTQNVSQDGNVYTVQQGERARITANINTNKGLIGWAKVNSIGDRCADGDCHFEVTGSDLTIPSFAFDEPGTYVFDTNVYSDDCQYMCSASGVYYQSNGCGDCYDSCNPFRFPNDQLPEYKDHCSTDCLKYVVVEAETPPPTLSCSSLQITGPNLQPGSESGTFVAPVGATITVASTISTDHGLIAWAQVDNTGNRCADGNCQHLVTGTPLEKTLTLNEPGVYVFEANAHSNATADYPACAYACIAGGGMYQNPSTDPAANCYTRNSWTAKPKLSSYCTNNCRQYIVIEGGVTPSVTPSPPPQDVVIEGYKRDDDTNAGLADAQFAVHKIFKTADSNAACNGEHANCTDAQIITDSNGFFSVTCNDVESIGSAIGDVTGILITEQVNPDGYTDGDKDPVGANGCFAWDVNTVCCPLENPTADSYSATFYNKEAEAYTCSCERIKIYDENMDLVPPDQYAALQAGQLIYFGVSPYNGYSNYPVTKARVRVNRTAWEAQDETTEKKSGGEDFIKSYVIPEGITDFKVEAEIYLDAPGEIGGWR